MMPDVRNLVCAIALTYLAYCLVRFPGPNALTMCIGIGVAVYLAILAIGFILAPAFVRARLFVLVAVLAIGVALRYFASEDLFWSILAASTMLAILGVTRHVEWVRSDKFNSRLYQQGDELDPLGLKQA